MVKKIIMISFAILLYSAGMNAEARYVFLFIGDGMGMGHLMATKNYMRLHPENGDSLLMTAFPSVGIVTTFSASSPVTDSAAAGTAIACGKKTNNRMIGVTPDSAPLESVASFLHRHGYGVGIVTTVAPDDATPAAFYAHVPDRNMFDAIASDAIKSDFEFIGGANLRGDKSLYDKFRDNGISVARGMDEYSRVADSRRVLVLNTDTVLLNDLGYILDNKPGVLDLPQLTRMCLGHLMRHTPDKFFMMAEGGSIDHAAHANDGASVIKEMESFNKSLAIAFEFYRQHPDDTVIIVTADHDTGGMATVGNAGSLANVDYQHISKDRFNDMMKACLKTEPIPSWDEMWKIITESFSLGEKIKITKEEEQSLQAAYSRMVERKDMNSHSSIYASYSGFVDTLFKLVNSKMSVRWISEGHTANPVGVFAIGNATEALGKVIDNTQIYDFIINNALSPRALKHNQK